jgi:hypothetical protein
MQISLIFRKGDNFFMAWKIIQNYKLMLFIRQFLITPDINHMLYTDLKE